ncbi:MAG: NERD domain-containing protein [Candidatus Moranbacteria bacterium]|nr:NERD domain-containing protein [Candidatus Moranbacteria bacterium]
MMVSYPKKLYIRAVLGLVAIGSVYLTVFVLSSYLSLRDTTKYGILFLFLLGYLSYPGFKWLIDKIDSLLDPTIRRLVSSAKHAKRGIDGEDTVARWLDEIVGKDGFLRNVKLPGRWFDFDVVAVGEWGVVVFEVKNYSAALRFEDDACYVEKDGRWRLLPPEHDPRAKLPGRIHALRQYLDEKDFGNIPIHRALVVSGGYVSWTGSPGTYVIKDKAALLAYLGSLRPDPVCTAEVRVRLLRLLR